jgi:hypothetical protein
MRTLYIDHSIVTHEPSWEGLRLAIGSGKIRLALSVWNLYEIGAATDLAQRSQRLSFLSGLAPLYIVERRHIQRQEVERFLWQHKFSTAPNDIIAITPTLSGVDYFFAGARTRIGLTMCQFIHETDFAGLHPLKRLSPDALRKFQSVDRMTLKQKEREIFEAWIAVSIPDRAPNGHDFTVSEKAELVAFCWQHRKQFFAECRCLAVENALTTARTNDVRRNPTESDGLDLQHAAVALAYCDVFYSKDRYQLVCAAVARGALKTMGLGVICATPMELAGAVAAL